MYDRSAHTQTHMHRGSCIQLYVVAELPQQDHEPCGMGEFLGAGSLVAPRTRRIRRAWVPFKRRIDRGDHADRPARRARNGVRLRSCKPLPRRLRAPPVSPTARRPLSLASELQPHEGLLRCAQPLADRAREVEGSRGGFAGGRGLAARDRDCVVTGFSARGQRELCGLCGLRGQRRVLWN